MIPDFKTYLKESIWSDMQDRGTGELQKKEDDVNLMSHKRFVEYLKNNYVEIGHRLSGWEIATYGSNTLATPIFGYPTGNGIRNQCAFLFLDCKEKVVYTNKCIIKYAPDLLKKLNEKYDLWDDDPDYKDYIIINPTDTSKNPDHKYFLDLLNFILDNLDESTMHVITKKSMNESIWSDMQDRGTGDLEKKEDLVPVEEMEDFIDQSLHIYAQLYVQEGWQNDGEKLTYDIFAQVVKTSDSMQDIDDYEDYSEKKLDYILKYAKDKWDVYSKRLEEYVDDENLPF